MLGRALCAKTLGLPLSIRQALSSGAQPQCYDWVLRCSSKSHAFSLWSPVQQLLQRVEDSDVIGRVRAHWCGEVGGPFKRRGLLGRSKLLHFESCIYPQSLHVPSLLWCSVPPTTRGHRVQSPKPEAKSTFKFFFFSLRILSQGGKAGSHIPSILRSKATTGSSPLSLGPILFDGISSHPLAPRL